jgi:hypothetical protein
MTLRHICRLGIELEEKRGLKRGQGGRKGILDSVEGRTLRTYSRSWVVSNLVKVAGEPVAYISFVLDLN